MVLVLGISGTAEFFLIGKYRVLLTADRKTYVLVLIQIAGTVINTAISVALIQFTDVSILIIKAASAVGYLSRYVLILLYVRRTYPDLDLRAEPDTVSLNRRWDVLIHQIAGLIVFNLPVVLLTIFCDLKDVSVYMVYALVFGALNSLMDSFSNGLQAFFGKMMVQGDTRKVKDVYVKYETVYFIVLGWTYSCAYILTIPFMNIYTRNMIDAEYIQPTLMLFFVIVGLVNKLRIPAGLLINAVGHYRQTKYRALLEMGINIIASPFFVIKYGFTGVLLGSICSFAYRTLDMIIYSGKRFVPGTLLGTFGKITAGIFYYIAVIVLIHKILPYSGNSYAAWFVYASISGAIFAIPLVVFLRIYYARNFHYHSCL
jgi:O-antigen/teichoic acid export membrane protein